MKGVDRTRLEFSMPPKIIQPMMTLIGLMILVLLFAPSAHAAGKTTVGGRVVTDAGPFNGAKVHAYATYGDISGGGKAIASADCDKRGSYSFRLPKGEYYFVARGHLKGKEFFAFHGNNPIKVDTGENTWIALLATEVKQPVYTEGESALTGIVTYKGKPLTEGEVTLYKPDTKFKGPGVQMESLADDGTFRLNVPVGNYVVIARKRDGAKGNRPLKNGELFCYYPVNPVEVRKSKTTQIEVPCYPKDDRNAFVDTAQIKPGSFKTIDNLATGVTNGIRGRVTGQDGKPAEGLLVLAFRAFKPNFLTHYLSQGADYWTETGADGSYLIPVDISGDYYIVARETLGGIPQTGELYGLFNGNSRHAVTYEKSKVLDNVNLTVTMMADKQVFNVLPTPANERVSSPSGNDHGDTNAQIEGRSVAHKSQEQKKSGSEGQWLNSLTTEGNIQYLEAESRKEWLKPEEIVEQLFIKPGETIADLGSGTGSFSTLLARKTGKKGLVYAVDIEPEMVEYLEKRASKEGLDNIRSILGKPNDPLLPPASADLVLMFNIYPAIDNRVQYLARAKEILKKNGRLALISYTMAETPDGRPPMHRRISRDVAVQEAVKAGLKLYAEYFFLPYHYFLIFEKR